MSETSPRQIGDQGRNRWTVADLLSAARIPLAVAFPLASNSWRMVILALAAATDLLDGPLARRFGSSVLGSLIDPVADKLFMAAAFGVVAVSGRLAPYEVVGVLLRDIVATVAFALTLFSRRPRDTAARISAQIRKDFEGAAYPVSPRTFLIGPGGVRAAPRRSPQPRRPAPRYRLP